MLIIPRRRGAPDWSRLTSWDCFIRRLIGDIFITAADPEAERGESLSASVIDLILVHYNRREEFVSAPCGSHALKCAPDIGTNVKIR
jgi:hypothetical protein